MGFNWLVSTPNLEVKLLLRPRTVRLWGHAFACESYHSSLKSSQLRWSILTDWKRSPGQSCDCPSECNEKTMRPTTFQSDWRTQAYGRQPAPNLQIAQVEVIVTTTQDALASILEPRKFVFIWNAAARWEFSAFRSSQGKTDAAVWEPSEMHRNTFFEWGKWKVCSCDNYKNTF